MLDYSLRNSLQVLVVEEKQALLMLFAIKSYIFVGL